MLKHGPHHLFEHDHVYISFMWQVFLLLNLFSIILSSNTTNKTSHTPLHPSFTPELFLTGTYIGIVF